MATGHKHILMVTSWYHSAVDVNEGSFIQEQAEMLMANGYTVTLIHPHLTGTFLSGLFKKSVRIFDDVENNMRVIRIVRTPILPKMRGLSYWCLKRTTLRYIRKIKHTFDHPELVHSHSFFLGGYVGYFIAKEFQVRQVHTEHTSGLLANVAQYTWLDILTLKRMYPKMYKVLFVSNFAKKQMQENFRLDNKNLGVLHNLVNPLFSETDVSPQLNEQFSYIVIGELSFRKGFDYIIDAWRRLLTIYPDSQLTILGYGAYESAVIEQIKEFNLSHNITILPPKNRKAVAEIIAKHHVVFSASRLETFGLTIAEGIFAGKPVLATNSGGVLDIVTPTNGIVVTPDTDGLANGMIDIQKNYGKFNAEAIKREAEMKFSSATIMNQLSRIYHPQSDTHTLTHNDYYTMTVSCKNCLFTSDNYPEIRLDKFGVCDICHTNNALIAAAYSKQTEGYIEAQLNKILKHKKNKYDCLMGISGGSDSSYMIHLAKEWGLNPLLLHIDGGWNTETTVQNIKNCVELSGFDYVTHVIDWNEMRDLQRAFIQANVLDIDLPFDNLLLYYTFKIAHSHNIKYIFNGQSSTTEGIMPDSYTHYKLDRKNILDIHRKYGELKLKDVSFIGTFGYLWFDRVVGIEVMYPLDWIHYEKEKAIELLEKEYSWTRYDGKHYDNLFTRFYQGYILPHKFNIDKRISHLSMLICSHQLTKEEAIERLNTSDSYPNPELEASDKAYFIKKLGITEAEFERYIAAPAVSHRKFRSDLDNYDLLRPVYQKLKQVFKFNFFR